MLNDVAAFGLHRWLYYDETSWVAEDPDFFGTEAVAWIARKA